MYFAPSVQILLSYHMTLRESIGRSFKFTQQNPENTYWCPLPFWLLSWAQKGSESLGPRFRLQKLIDYKLRNNACCLLSSMNEWCVWICIMWKWIRYPGQLGRQKKTSLGREWSLLEVVRVPPYLCDLLAWHEYQDWILGREKDPIFNA
jgi:hypothetical protein